MPSVNEIFNPGRINSTFARSAAIRTAAIAEDKATNYGVVRLPLLEHIYETLYLQRITHGNTPQAENTWPHNILPYRLVTDVQNSPVVKDGLRLQIHDRSPLYLSDTPNAQERTETLDVDVVFVATGYQRDLHETLLGDARHLMPGGDLEGARWTVRRDYGVEFADKSIASDAGVWLQGCCEKTHGVRIAPLSPRGLISVVLRANMVRQLSDTLLSVLANRGGDMVNAIFGEGKKDGWERGVSNGVAHEVRA